MQKSTTVPDFDSWLLIKNKIKIILIFFVLIHINIYKNKTIQKSVYFLKKKISKI